MMNATKAMFDTPNRGNQSSNINQLSPELGNIAYQVKGSLLAGNNSIWANRSLTKNLVSQSAKIYANQSGEYFSDCNSGEHLSTPKRESAKGGEFTPFTKGNFSHLMQGLIGVTIRGRIEFFESIKKGSQSATLGNVDIEYRASENYQHSDHFAVSTDKSECLVKNFDDNHFTFLLTFGYSKNALAKSSVRIETLNQLTATHDAPSVFFCVYAYAYLQFAVLYRPNSMVMLAGQPKGWLESVNSSSLNPVSVTTPIEIETSGGDSLTKLTEIIVMMATPTQTQFKFLFLAVKRTDKTDIPHRIEATAPSEHDARLMLVRDYILSFAGRLPVKEVTA